MKVTYTGLESELTPVQKTKLDAAFAKLGKMLDNGRGEVEARVVVSHTRHLNDVEITVPYYDHELVGDASEADLLIALHEALAKLEKQAIKVREKWRDGKRVPSGRQETWTGAPEE